MFIKIVQKISQKKYQKCYAKRMRN